MRKAKVKLLIWRLIVQSEIRAHIQLKARRDREAQGHVSRLLLDRACGVPVALLPILHGQGQPVREGVRHVHQIAQRRVVPIPVGVRKLVDLRTQRERKAGR